MSTGVVAALRAEARVFARGRVHPDGLFRLPNGTLLACSGMGCEAAARAASALIGAGARALVSFGLAGGLDPALEAGTLCLPTEIAQRDQQSLPTDAMWRRRVVSALTGRVQIVQGTLLTNSTALHDTRAKEAAFRNTGAQAVDMESAAVARAAEAGNIPFVALRVIVDTAADGIPAIVLAASRAGNVHVPKLLWGLVRAPSELGALLRLAQRYRAAMHTLEVVAHSGVYAT